MPSTEIAKIDSSAAGVPRVMSQREQEVVRDILQEFSQMTTWRNVFAGQWEEAAQLIYPVARNTFFYGNYNWPGQKKNHQQIDASGMMALHRFGAICDSMITPRNQQYQELKASNDYVMKDRATRLWFEQATRTLFKYRYNPLANFTGQNQGNWKSLGAFGNAAMFIDRLDGRLLGGARGLRYKSIPLGELFIRENHQGLVDGFIRWFRMTAYQAVQKWGIERLPANLHSALAQHSQWTYNFLHCVRPRDDYDPERLDSRGMPYGSYYVSIEGQCLMAPEGGYNSLPISAARYSQGPNEVYGRGPAQMVLPSLKTINAQKSTFLKQGHRAADPVLLTADDGITDMSMRPGAMNKGGVTSDGKLLVHTLPTGSIAINEKMMEMESKIIDAGFLVDLFRLILDEKVLTATQVTEIVNQKGILIGPELGGQNSGYLEPMTVREMDVLSEQDLLPPMPPRLKEASGEYSIEWTSPLARTQRAGEAAGYLRTLEIAHSVAQNTGDESVYDHFDFDASLPAIADINGSPESWMASAEKKAAKREGRARVQAAQMKIQAAPAEAAMMKAQAVQAKAGMGEQQGAPQ